MNKEILPYVSAYMIGTLLGSVIVAGIIKVVLVNNQKPRGFKPAGDTLWDEIQAMKN